MTARPYLTRGVGFTLVLALATLVTVAAGGAVAQEHSAGPTSTAVENVDQNATYSSIQAAVDNASAGQTLAVSAGTYNESVVVDVPGLAVRGPNAGTPATDNRTSEAVVDTSAGSGSNAAITVTADGVTIDGLAVESSVRDGILVSDPVDDVTIENTRIRSVAGAVGGKAAGNGIDLFYTGSTQTSSNVTIRNNRIANITTPDASVDADAIGIQVLPRGSETVGLTIAGNVITGIDPGNSTDDRSDGRGISIDTQLVNGSGVVSGLTVTGNSIEDVTGESVRGVALFESSTDPAIGPTNFTITRNRFDDLSSSNFLPAEAMYVGAYKNLGSSHAFTENDILDGVVTRFADQSNPEQFFSDGDALNAVDNWWGDASGPGGAGPGTGQRVFPDPTEPPFSFDNPEIAVEFDPFLEQPVDETFFSVQEAIDRASPGDTVQVPADTYDESVVVDVPGLTLQGPNAGVPATGDRTSEAFIDFDNAPASGGAAVTIAADNVTLDGFRIESAGQDGITVPSAVDNVTIANTRITSVAGNTFGSSNGPRGAGNGINLQYGNSQGQVSDGIVIRDNLISGVTSPDTTARTYAIGIQVLPRGNNVTDLRIENNVVADISSGNSSEGDEEVRGVVVGTQLVDGTGVATGLTVSGNEFRNLTAGAVRALALFESSTDPAIGPTNFTIRQNSFASLNSSGAFRPNTIFVGAYKDLGASHTFTQNNILDGTVTRFADRSNLEQFIRDADALNATNNWWGNTTGPSGAGPGTGQAVVPDPTQFGIQNPEIAVNFDPFRGTPVVETTAGGRVAQDTDGDNLLDDVGGDGDTTLLDVQTLFDSLDDPAVQTNAQFFNFAGVSPDQVTVLDVQGLFNEL